MAHGVWEKEINGRKIRIEADYTCEMKPRYLDADGWQVRVEDEPHTESNMVVYVDGQKYDTCWNDNFWGLITVPGHEGKKIWGIKLGFKSQKICESYEEFIKTLKDDGTKEEVKAYKAAIKAKQDEELRETAQSVLEACERSINFPNLPTKEEAKRRMKAYNDVVNEGGEGYVPRIYSQDDYEWAKSILSRFEKN